MIGKRMWFGWPSELRDAEETTAAPFLRPRGRCHAAGRMLSGGCRECIFPTSNRTPIAHTGGGFARGGDLRFLLKEERIRIEIRAWTDGVTESRCIAVRAEQMLLLRHSAPEPIAFLLSVVHGTIEAGASIGRSGNTFCRASILCLSGREKTFASAK